MTDGERERRIMEWMELYSRDLFRLCFVMLADAGRAEDAVQDAFFKAWRTLNRFQGQCSPRTWLIRIAVNVCRDQMRTQWFRHVDTAKALDALPEAQCPPEDRTLMLDVMNLPPKIKRVVLLYYYEKMTQQEIAELLGMKRSSVQSALSKGLTMLRMSWKEDDLR